MLGVNSTQFKTPVLVDAISALDTKDAKWKLHLIYLIVLNVKNIKLIPSKKLYHSSLWHDITSVPESHGIKFIRDFEKIMSRDVGPYLSEKIKSENPIDEVQYIKEVYEEVKTKNEGGSK